TGVDGRGGAGTRGLLSGDERGRHGQRVGHPAESGELLAFLRWTVGEAPAAAGYWPAQAVANHALAGRPVLDTTTAATAYPLFDWTGWDAGLAAEAGVPPRPVEERAGGEIRRAHGRTPAPDQSPMPASASKKHT